MLKKELTSNTKVKVSNPSTSVPNDIEWVKDIRINSRTKKQLIEGFWKGKKGISAKISYVSSESIRTKLKKEKKVMVQLMDQCAQKVTVIVPEQYLEAK